MRSWAVKVCGIAGFVSEGVAQREREAVVHRMLAALHHRGPDAQRVITFETATLGAARLSIVDRKLGHQPMVYEEEGQARAMMAYNGEVYNFLDLRQRLGRDGVRFRTRSDTEVVLASHVRWGESAVAHFDGMFAYAIWDPLQHRLLLVRDRLGIKPLFYVQVKGGLLFASEPKALLASGLATPSPNPLAVVEFFTHGSAFASGYVTHDRTFFQDILALPPGHLLRWDCERHEISRYWSPLEDLGHPPPTESCAAAALEQLLVGSVRSMLMGEVLIGTALSGGLDSSAITAVATELLDKELLSASITYREDHDDPDARHATLLSNWLNERRPGCHRLEYTHLSEATYLQDLDRLVQAFDEPHWEPRQVAMFANYRTLAQHGRTVILTGEGSDELFFGYFQKFPGFRRPASSGPADLIRHWRQRLPWVRNLLRPTFANGLPLQTPDDLLHAAVAMYLAPYWRATGDRLRAIQCWYLHTFLPWLLMDNDRCSMAHSLEGRFPFLANDLVAFALKLPPEWNIPREGHTGEKLLLRKTFSQRLPREIWLGRAKSPLPLPQQAAYHRVIADTLAEEIEAAPPGAWEFLSKEFVKATLSDFLAKVSTIGDTERADESLAAYLPLDAPLEVRTQQLFAILTFLRWYSLRIDSRAKVVYECEPCYVDDPRRGS